MLCAFTLSPAVAWHLPRARPSLSPPPLLWCAAAPFHFRYSNRLQKDDISGCLRILIGRLGQVLSQWRPASVAFNFGKFVVRDRKVAFHFDPELKCKTLNATAMAPVRAVVAWIERAFSLFRMRVLPWRTLPPPCFRPRRRLRRVGRGEQGVLGG